MKSRIKNNELYHHGILGMSWGVRNGPPYPLGAGDHSSSEKKAGWRKSLDGSSKRTKYRSSSIRGAIAKAKNKKVDKSFQKWKKNDKYRSDAIIFGQEMNQRKLAYESSKSSEDKKRYKESKREFKQAYRKNTTYRKGQVKKEVLSDISRKHLSEAKRVEKQLKQDPNNKELQKKYSKLMSQHDIERAKARRAPEVAANRSKYKASLKRMATMTVKSAAATAAISIGVDAINKIANNIVVDGDKVRYMTKVGKNVFKYV